MRAMLCEPRVKGHRAAAVSTRKPSLVDGVRMVVTDTLQKDRSGEATVDHGLHVRRARRDIQQPQGANEALRWVAARMQ